MSKSFEVVTVLSGETAIFGVNGDPLLGTQFNDLKRYTVFNVDVKSAGTVSIGFDKGQGVNKVVTGVAGGESPSYFEPGTRNIHITAADGDATVMVFCCTTDVTR